MNPKSGAACTSVDPTLPDEVVAADVADPGKVATAKAEQIQKKDGKYGTEPIKPFKPKDPDSTDSSGSNQGQAVNTSWVEIELVDDDNKPVAGEKFEITLPDNTVAKGTLDAKGVARVDGIDPGSCKISFPELDKSAWNSA